MMSAGAKYSLIDFLNQHDEEAWSTALTELLPSIHEVDRTATRIWFAFFPLSLQRALQASDEPEKLAQKLLLEGKYNLAEQIDTSAHFLYGHRYWAEVKRTVLEQVEAGGGSPTQIHLDKKIQEVTEAVATRLKTDSSLLAGITAVALMTLQQVGIEAFRKGSGDVSKLKVTKKSPDQILRERSRDDSQGIFGFLRTEDKRWTVTFDEQDEGAKFKLINAEEIASASAHDTRDWRARDPRCIEGPIPVQCRSASCGTCWIGVLGGAEKLSDMSERETRKLKEFGYINTCEPKPVIRLACMARSSGAISIVIPPWNGVFGQYLQTRKNGQEDAPAIEANNDSLTN